MPKDRSLRAAREEERLAAFAERCARLGEYTDCTFGARAATAFGGLCALPFAAASVVLYLFCAPRHAFLFAVFAWDFFLLGGAIMLSTLLHECLHALGWAAANGSFRGIRMGIAARGGIPYCACGAPMRAPRYLLGSLAPFVLLGAGLSVAAILTGYWALAALAAVNILMSGADLLVSARALAGGTLLDHPFRCGFYRFRTKTARP